MSWNSDLVINFVNFLYGMEWQPHTTRSSIFRMDHSMNPMCSFAARVFRCAGDKKKDVFKLIVAMEISDDEPAILLLGLNFLKPRYDLRFASDVA